MFTHDVLFLITIFCSRFRAKVDNADSQDKMSANVDMEEIFKQVLENASKALIESDTEKRSKTDVVSSPSCFPEEFQIQKATSSLLQQQESDSCPIEGNSGNSLTALPSCDKLMQPYVVRLFACTTIILVQYYLKFTKIFIFNIII